MNQPVRLDLHALLFPHKTWRLSSGLVMVSALVFEESELLCGKVGAECDGRDAEAREGALEALEAGEGSGVPPLFTADA
jgi:hypothetical protein